MVIFNIKKIGDFMTIREFCEEYSCDAKIKYLENKINEYDNKEDKLRKKRKRILKNADRLTAFFAGVLLALNVFVHFLIMFFEYIPRIISFIISFASMGIGVGGWLFKEKYNDKRVDRNLKSMDDLIENNDNERQKYIEELQKCYVKKEDYDKSMEIIQNLGLTPMLENDLLLSKSVADMYLENGITLSSLVYMLNDYSMFSLLDSDVVDENKLKEIREISLAIDKGMKKEYSEICHRKNLNNQRRRRGNYAVSDDYYLDDVSSDLVRRYR